MYIYFIHWQRKSNIWLVILSVSLLTDAPAGPGDPGVPASPRGPCAPSGPRAPVGPASPCRSEDYISLSRLMVFLILQMFKFENGKEFTKYCKWEVFYLRTRGSRETWSSSRTNRTLKTETSTNDQRGMLISCAPYTNPLNVTLRFISKWCTLSVFLSKTFTIIFNKYCVK